MKRLYIALALLLVVGAAYASECRVDGCASGLLVDAQSEQCCTDANEAWVCKTSMGGTQISCGNGHPDRAGQPGATWCVPEGPGGWDAVSRWCNSNGVSGIGGAVRPLEAANASEAIAKAQRGEGTIVGGFGGSGFYNNTGWLRDWKAAGTVAVMISILLVALGYIFGFALNSREMKAWAAMELVQAFGSVLILASLIGLVAFFDIVAEEVAQSTMQTINYGSACTEELGKPCAMHVAEIYISSLVDAASTSAKGMLENSVQAGLKASRRGGVQVYSFYALWAGGSWGPDAGMTMQVDKFNALFDYYAKILASLQAQRYFIDVITYGIAPAFLLIGVVLRTFFFTRKLGGLLIAIAIALLIIYPLTYIFSWLTLTVAVYGQNMFAASDSCPAECKINPPIANYRQADGTTKFDIKDTDTLQAAINLEAIVVSGGSVSQINAKTGGGYSFPAGNPDSFIACYDLSTSGLGGEANACANCPTMCREVPYPTYNQLCMQQGIETACRQCNVNCKKVMPHSTCTDPGAGDYCSQLSYNPAQQKFEAQAECTIGQPMEEIIVSNALSADYPENPTSGICSDCAGCPAYCRMRIHDADAGTTKLREDVSGCNVDACKKCAGVDPYQNTPQAAGACVITVQKAATSSCDAQCSTCPAYCRVSLNGEKTYPQGCTQAACRSCPMGCYISPLTQENSGLCAAPPDGHQDDNCQSCKNTCRYSDYSLPADSNNAKDDVHTAQVNEGVCGEFLAADGSGVCNDNKCAAECKAYGLQYSAANVPRLCRDYKAGGALACESCTLDCRVKLTYTNAQNNQVAYQDKSALCTAAHSCADNTCVAPCMKTAALSNAASCQPYDANAADAGSCKKCNYDCRILVNGEVPAACDTPAMQGACLAQNCAGACKVEVGTDAKPPVCMPYLGAGAGGDVAALEISARQAPYNDRTECRQCPEECRVGGEGGCSLDSRYYDCSYENCPNSCRASVPANNGGTCKEFNYKFCKSCPLECRLTGVSIPDRDTRCAACTDCVSECKAKVPFGVCDKYAECSQDCLGEPRIRTDCADRCVEGELSGVSKITPASFITKIGGATTDSETKNVGIFMLPAVVLPLFGIVLMLSFIRALSPILGGEVEIPAIARLI
ncbi:Uncharacterised protein [Candidatus Anstonella stagnisolia]|nr:Uncharacterised protein [Candidatus Anstonella stagnisolia]